MKRRNFIEATLVGAMASIAPAAGKSEERLYGTPGSLGNGGVMSNSKFMLPLARSGAPVEGWTELSAASQLIEDILASSRDAAAFFKNPQKMMKKYGLDASDRTLSDETIILLTSLTHPAIQENLAKSNYQAAFSLMEAAGLVEKREPSLLEKKLQVVFSDNIADIRKAINAAKTGPLNREQQQKLISVLGEHGVGATETDLAALINVLSSDAETPQIGMLTLVVLVSVAVAVLAAVVTHAGVLVSVMTDVMGAAAKQQAGKSGMLFDGSFARFDPALMRNLDRLSRVAHLKSDQGLQAFAFKKLIAEESGAVMRALYNVGALTIKEKNLPALIEATTLYSCKVAGIKV